MTSSRSAVNLLISRKFSSRTQAHSAREFKVLLDNQTLYVGQELAEAMGWSDKIGVDGVKLSLHGLSPTFFSITPTGSDSGECRGSTDKVMHFTLLQHRTSSTKLSSERYEPRCKGSS